MQPRLVSLGALARVLLVDDDALLRRMVAQILRADGFEALQAGCADEAIGILQQLDEPPQAIITDVAMPGTSVMRLVDEACRSKPAIPILLMSGGHDNLEVATAVRRGELQLLPKPFKGPQLLEWLRRHVQCA